MSLVGYAAHDTVAISKEIRGKVNCAAYVVQLGQLGKAAETPKERGNFSGCAGLGFGRFASTSWRFCGRVREGFADAQAGFPEGPPKVRGRVI